MKLKMLAGFLMLFLVFSSAQAFNNTTMGIIMMNNSNSSSKNLTEEERTIIREKRRKEAIEKAKQAQMNKTFSAIDTCRKETGYTGKAYKAFSSQEDGSLVDMEKQAFAECMKNN